MGITGSSPYNVNIPGGGTEGYHVLKVSKKKDGNFKFPITAKNNRIAFFLLSRYKTRRLAREPV